jgi:hypothetical protein
LRVTNTLRGLIRETVIRGKTTHRFRFSRCDRLFWIACQFRGRFLQRRFSS